MKLLLNMAFLAIAVSAFSQTPAFDKNAQLGRGINLGNMFEAPSETAWGNPFQDEYMQQIADLGFNHVRIPIQWESAERSLPTTPYTINQEFLARIQHVVDLALQHKLHAIIDMHHHEALFQDPDGQKARFLSMWNQITHYFSNYSDSLVFELMNEPNTNLTSDKWNDFLKDGIDTIRQTSPNRFILVGTSDWGGLGGLPNLVLPEDDHLIVTIHYYNPFSFTHQGAEWVSNSSSWLGTTWMDTESERMTVQSEFTAAVNYSQNHNVPIHVGEFGAYSTADLASRIRWTNYLARYFESLNFSWGYWEYCAGFGIYNPSSKTYVTGLVDALLHNPMPDPTPVNRTEIIKTLFNTDGNTDGWNLYNNGGASSSGSVSNGTYTISIQNGGTEGWHVQLSLNNIELENGKDYEVRIQAKASEERTIFIYAGMNKDPWSSYSGYSSYTLGTGFNLYTLSFQMQNATDLNSRLVIDLGKSASSVVIDEVSIYEVSLATSAEEVQKPEPVLYPNPTSGMVYFKQMIKNSPVNIYSSTGLLIMKTQLNENLSINLHTLPSGQYLVQWQTDDGVHTEKLVKY